MALFVASTPLHAVPASGPTLSALLALAALGSALVLALALAALRRRRSLPYALVALAFGALSARAFVGALTMTGHLAPSTHHLAEHGLDVAVVGLLVGAVYYARTVEREL
jgi:hypothetical protein